MCVTGWMTKETYLWSWMMCFVKKFQVIRKHTVFLISCNILWYFYRTILASEKSRSIISWNKKVFKLYLFQKNELNQVFVLHPFPASTIKSCSQFAWLTISHISKISPKSVCSRTFSDYRAQPCICLATGAEAAPGRAPEGCYQGTCSGLVPDSILYCCHLEILNNFLTRAPTFPLFTGPTHYASGPEQHKQTVFQKQEDRSAKGSLGSVGTTNFGGGDLTTSKISSSPTDKSHPVPSALEKLSPLR